MMKLHRSALMAGLLALGVAACGDDVQVVEPTPPPPPPLEATMTPGAATIAVGNSADFAVGTSGGAAGATASWTCATSNPGVASVTTTATGCRATGVAAGGATITAAVTKGDETSNVGAELTVTEDEEAVVTINAINQGGVPAVSPFGGQLDVVINVERGDQILEQLNLWTDVGTPNAKIVASQTFAAAAPGADDEAAEQVQTITLSFNTANYCGFSPQPCQAGQSAGDVDHLNGGHTISAQLTIAGGSTPVASNTIASVFFNADGVHVVATPPSNSAISAATGLNWYGGPNSGTVDITVIPIMFSGRTVNSVTINPFCGDVAATDTASPYVFAPDCRTPPYTTVALPGGDVPGFAMVADGNTVAPAPAILNVANTQDHPFPIRLDFAGPGAPQFAANPNGRQNGWINGSVGLVGSNTGPTDDDWLINGAADTGVGGYTRWMRVDATAPATVNAAIALPPDPAPALPAPTVNNNDLCFVASAADDLGNESALPAAGTGCLTPPFASWVATGTAHLRGGVDIMAPTIAFTGASVAANARLVPPAPPEEFQVTVADVGAVGNSGMLSGAPVIARLESRTAATDPNLVCGGGGLPGIVVAGVCTNNATGLAVALPLVTTTGITPVIPPGIHTLSALGQDAAGNQTAEISRTITRDNVPLVGSAPQVPLTITGPFLASAFLNDDLSIRDYYWTAGYTTALTVLTTLRLSSAPTAVDAYNGSPLTNTNFAVNTTISTFLGLQPAAAAYVPGSNPLSSANLWARDQTQVAYTANPSAPFAPTPPATGIPVANAAPAWVFGAFAEATSNPVICAGIGGAPACSVAGGPTSTTWTATATGTTATFPNPFSRVDFYMADAPFVDMRLIGSVPASGATLVDNGATRVWTYSLGVNAASLYAAIGGVSPAVPGARFFYAFGVNAAGNVAMVSPGTLQTVDPGT